MISEEQAVSSLKLITNSAPILSQSLTSGVFPFAAVWRTELDFQPKSSKVGEISEKQNIYQQ